MWRALVSIFCEAVDHTKRKKSKQCRGTNRKTPDARTFFDGTYVIICTHSGTPIEHFLRRLVVSLVNSAGPYCVTGRVNFWNRFSFVNSFKIVRRLKECFRCAWLVVNVRTSIGKWLLVDYKHKSSNYDTNVKVNVVIPSSAWSVT